MQCRSASNTGYSRAPNDRAAKAAASVHKRVEGYSGNLALATQRDRAGIYSSIQTQTTPFQWRGAVSNIASKCPGSEARDWLSARERSSRASPSTRAGERVLQPLLRGTQEGWGASPNFGSQTHQQSALRTSVQDGDAEADPGADSPRGLVCVRGFEGRVLSHSDSAAIVSGPDRAADSPPMADSGQEGHVISGGRLGVAPEPRTMEPSCVVASGLSGELDALQARVVGTLTEARAPSTRRLYALKWGVFVKWCHQAHIDPVVCTVLDVLSFLQYRLDSGSLPSTLKVYVAAIASFRSPQGGQSIGRDPMVVSFLKGARRLHPPRPPSVPPWDLEVVLRALSQPPFEPLSSVGLKELSLKTALLLALASAKRIGDLHAFSVDSDCIRFGPGDCSVTLRPRMGYVPKSLSTPFKIQTVSLSALSSESAASSEADAQTSVCPVRALRIYIDRSASFRQSNQLFVCYGGCARGRAVSKQRLSHWIVDAITAAYTNQGLECPLHIRGHSTRAMASSWAWSRGMSIQDICVAAGWSSENTFARFYRLDVQSFASQVLSVSG